jgi:hypothetical protein
MANWTILKEAIASVIKTNDNQEITGQLLQNALNNIITNVGENATFAGIATPTTNPGTPDGPVFYIATTAGSYSNFSSLEVSKGETAILQWNNGTWTKNAIKPMAEFESGIIYDVSANNDGAVFESLQALLSSSNLSTLIPTSVRYGGMSIRFIQSSDNKYEQFRCIANEFTTDVAKWQNVGNFLEEKETSYSEENVAGYITDKKGTIVARLMKNGAVVWTVKNSRDTQVDNAITELGNRIVAEKDRAELAEGALQTVIQEVLDNQQNYLREESIDIEDKNVAGYITDKNKAIIVKINKDGSINRLVENDRDKHTVHFEDVDIEGIANLLTDKCKKIIASINDKAEVDFYGGGGFAGEKTTEAKTGEYVRLLVSKNKVVIGGVKKDGTVHLFKAKIDNLDTEVDINITALINALPVIASGLNNVEISNDQRIINLLTSVNSTKVIDIKGVNIKNKLKPIMSIVDDDTVDGQIPSSMGKSVPGNTGGYFSVLLPIILSLNDKYDINAKVGLACEGHRVGLTSFYQPNDDYSQLNENGNLLKLLSNKIGWDILNHSMSAQLPVNTYGVDSINSALAGQILAEGSYVSPLNFYNTIVLDKSTGKWYEVNSTKTAWVERVPTKKYAMLYYRDYGTNNYHINRDFDFDYSWGEWFKRAKELGLPYKSCIAYNGSSTSPFTIGASRKYAEYGVRTTLDMTNVPPIPAAVARYSIIHSSKNNAEVPSYLAKMKSLVDECYSKHSWLVWMSHANNNSLQNRYNTGVDYGLKKDNNYSSEWEIPLNASEITTMDENNYWVNPPARLGISRWKDWHPAPGTQIGAFYEVLEYAINKGIDIVTPTEGWSTHGNLMQIGVDMMNTHAIYNIVDAYTDAEQSFLTVGADGSIRYFSK